MYFLKCIFLKCFYPKCIFAKCTRLACPLSFASLFHTKLLSRAINYLVPIILFQTNSKFCIWRFWRYVQVFGYSVSGVVLNVKLQEPIPNSNLTANDPRIRKWFLLKNYPLSDVSVNDTCYICMVIYCSYIDTVFICS